MNVFVLDVSIPQLTQECEYYLSLISLERRNKICKFRYIKDQMLSLSSELMMRYIISQELSIPFQKITFSIHKSGKLFLEGYPNYHFSISHSEKKVAFVSDITPVGIDIEKEGKSLESVAKRYFHPDELRIHKDNNFTNRDFYRIWTAKEAYVKLLGIGITDEFSLFSIFSSELQPRLHTIIMQDYVISAMASKPIEQPLPIQYFSTGELLSGIKSIL